MAVDSTSFNPYAMMYGMNAQNTYGQDFMSDATGITNPYICQPDATRVAKQSAFTGSNLSGQPATDCYQSSSGFGTGVKLALAGGAGTALGMYYFGGDKVNPISNGVFHDDVLKAVEKDYKEVAKNLEKAKLNTAVEKAIKDAGHFDSIEQYYATKTYLTTPVAERGNLPQEIINKVHPQAINNPNVYGNKLTLTERAINGVDVEKIQNEALAEAQKNHLGYQSEQLANLQKQKSLISGLAKDADVAKYEELIKSNPKAFGIEATEATTIEAEAKRIASGFTSRESLLTDINGKITNQLDVVKNTRKYVNGTVINHWDDAAKELKPTAPEALTKAVKNAKFTKVGKAGLIAAGVGLVLGWMFGGKS